MAEQAAGTVATAVINGVTERALTTVMRKLRSRSPAAHEKLQQLETLVLKLRCAVEVSEKHAIGSASLLEWRDRLREAAAEGGAVVLDFQRRAREEEDREAASTSAPGQQQPGAGAMYFTRSALSGMARRVRNATRRLFSADEDMEKLDGTLEKMQRLSPDITQFLTALQLEVSLELGRRPAKRRAPAPIPIPAERIQRRRESMGDNQPDTAVRLPLMMRALHSPSRCPVESSARVTLCDSEQGRKALATSDITRLASAGEAEDPEREARRLANVLETTLRRVASYIKVMDNRDMGGFDWLAEWAAVLREVVERGNAVLQTLRRPGSDVIHKAGGALEEDGELYSFARAVQRLAWDELCFFVLVDICPSKQ